jgi:hypothetical protein
MPILSIYIDAETLGTLTAAAAHTGRTIEDLAESAVANEAANYRAAYPITAAQTKGPPATTPTGLDPQSAAGGRSTSAKN